MIGYRTEVACYAAESTATRRIWQVAIWREKKIEEELRRGVFGVGGECQALLALLCRTLAAPLGRSMNRGVPFILNQLSFITSRIRGSL